MKNNLENLSNDDLRYIIQYSEQFRSTAHKNLLKLIGVEEIPNEEQLIV